MAEPLLKCPSNWLRGTLEPERDKGLIVNVDSGGTPSTQNDEYWDGDILWLTPKEITNLKDSVYVSMTERSVTEIGLKKSSAKLLPVGTVMLTKRAPVGVVAINAVPMATNQGFLNFQCGPNLRPLYLAYWFRVNRLYLERVANGSTYPELYKSDLFELEIAIPTLEEQDAIIQVINALQYVLLLGVPIEQSVMSAQQMIKIQQQNQRLRAIRDAILPMLLSGELDVLQVLTKFKEIIL